MKKTIRMSMREMMIAGWGLSFDNEFLTGGFEGLFLPVAAIWKTTVIMTLIR